MAACLRMSQSLLHSYIYTCSNSAPKGIPPSSFPAMFQASLEPSVLVSMMDTFLATLCRSQGDHDTVCAVKAFMDAFTKVPRLGTVLLFLSEREKEIVREVWEKLGMRNVDGVWTAVC